MQVCQALVSCPRNWLAWVRDCAQTGEMLITVVSFGCRLLHLRDIYKLLVRHHLCCSLQGKNLDFLKTSLIQLVQISNLTLVPQRFLFFSRTRLYCNWKTKYLFSPLTFSELELLGPMTLNNGFPVQTAVEPI